MSSSDSMYAKKDHDILWAWGRNDSYILGSPANTYIFTPTNINMGDVLQIAVKTSNVVVLSGVGAAWCWGENSVGQCGDNSVVDRKRSVAVVGGHSFTKVQAGDRFSVGLKGDSGEVWAWGYNSSGQLGDDTTGNKSSPIQVVGNHSFNDIIVGWSHTLALKSASGEVWVWGLNNYGQLGNLTTDNKSSPTLVVGNHTFIELAGGMEHSLALKANGGAWAWGLNTSGQLGDNSIIGKSSPVLVVGSHSFDKITAGQFYSAARKDSDGSAWSWGDGKQGQLGQTFALISRSSPVLVVGSHSFTQVVAGRSNTYGRKASGEIWAWGYAFWGTLGLGKETFTKASPIKILGGGYATIAPCLGDTTFAKTADRWYAWGLNISTQTTLPYGAPDASYPQAILNSEYFIQWDGGQSRSLAINEVGHVYNWGLNPAIDVGKTVPRSSPHLIVPNHSFTKISKHYGQYDNQSLGLKADGSIWSWGDKRYTVGDGTITEVYSPSLVVGDHSFIDVVSGEYHALALKANGEIWTWGGNGQGQLGDGTFVGKESPIKVIGPYSFVAIGAGYRHSIAIEGSDGSCWTWGISQFGNLGLNAAVPNQSSPRLVVGNHSFVQVAGGYHFGGALKANGEIWMWGHNNWGQVGDNTSNNRSSPVKVYSGLYKSLSCGYDHSTALSTGDRAYCWGYNEYGQIGQGDAMFIYSRPMAVNGGHDFLQAFAGYKCSTALGMDLDVGEIWSWGLNQSGQCADESGSSYEDVPVEAVGNHSFSQIFLTGGIKTNDSVWRWGQTPTGLHSLVWGKPTLTHLGTESFIQVAAGEFHAFMRKENGEVWTWGTNTYGQLGINTVDAKTSPVLVVGSHSFDDIAGGGDHSMGVKGGDGAAWSWGRDFYGQLGDNWPRGVDFSSPVLVISDAANLVIGGLHSLFLDDTTGQVWSWGYNNLGQLGDSTRTNQYASPVQVVGNHSFIDIGGSGGYSCALKGSTGAAWSWGSGGSGVLGNNSIISRSSPVVAVGNHSFVELAFGWYATLARKANGEVWAWGSNNSSSPCLGQATYGDRSSPVEVIGNHNFTQIAGMAGAHIVALKGADGSAWAWGSGTYYQIGDNAQAHRTSPVAVVGNHSFIQVGVGHRHSGGLKADGSIWAWGYNDYGQLGLNNRSHRSSPTAIVGSHSFVELRFGLYISAARKADGSIWTWGRNIYGELGQDTLASCSSPIQVVGNHSFSGPMRTRSNVLYAKKSTDEWWAIGRNQYRAVKILEYGNDQSSPVAVVGNHSFLYTSLGYTHSLMLKDNGQVWSCGRSAYGELGYGAANTSRSSPVLVVGSHSFIEINAGLNTSMALKANGEAWCWGYGGYGTMGNNSTSNRNVPVKVVGSHSFTEIATSNYAHYGKKANGEVWAWGYNNYGKLGDGTITNRSSPVLVVGSHYFDSIKIARIVMGFPISWGYFSNISEDYSRSFQVTWTPGTVIVNEGDAEALGVHAGTNEISSVIHTFGVAVECVQNKYGSGDTFTDVKYRHGATQAACEVASWIDYIGGFTSLGYVQFKLTRAA